MCHIPLLRQAVSFGWDIPLSERPAKEYLIDTAHPRSWPGPNRSTTPRVYAKAGNPTRGEGRGSQREPPPRIHHISVNVKHTGFWWQDRVEIREGGRR